MTEPAHQAILRRLPKGPLVGAEVGVLRGHNAAQLLAARPELLLYCVDNWTFGDLVPESPAEIRRQARANLRMYEDRVVWQEMESFVAAEEHKPRSLDFVFIDASHDYESVAADIYSWKEVVKAKGLLGGHDYGHPRFPEVQKAVDNPKITVMRTLEIDGLCWFVRV